MGHGCNRRQTDLLALCMNANAETMAVRDPLEDESLTLSSSASDPACDAVVGYLEDIIMDERRVPIVSDFIVSYYQEFEDRKE